MSLTSIVYVSAAKSLFTETAIKELLRDARAKNAAVGVTGLLLYWDGNFLQYIEGPTAAVETLFDKIRIDSRHYEIIVLDRSTINARLFPDWRMGFERIRSLATAENTGVTSYLADGDFGPNAETMAPHVRRLIELFREQLR